MWYLVTVTTAPSFKKMSGTSEGHNILLKTEAVVTVTKYHKAYSRSHQHKVIHRYLPREVRKLIVYYLWLVLPTWEPFQDERNPKRGTENSLVEYLQSPSAHSLTLAQFDNLDLSTMFSPIPERSNSHHRSVACNEASGALDWSVALDRTLFSLPPTDSSLSLDLLPSGLRVERCSAG